MCTFAGRLLWIQAYRRENFEDVGVSSSAKRKLSCSSTCKVCYFFYELEGLGMLPTANVLDTVQHDVSVTIGNKHI